MGNAYFKGIIDQGDLPEVAHHDYGCRPGRRREGAILNHMTVSQRLYQIGWVVLKRYFDVVNAFWSPDHECLKEDLSTVLAEDDKAICKTSII